MTQEDFRQRARRLTGPDGAGFTDDILSEPSADQALLAWAVKDEGLAAWTVEPQRTQRCATWLDQMRQHADNAEIAAAASWCRGAAQLALGEMEPAIASLDHAHRLLVKLGQAEAAVQSQIPKVMALAMLGRHDEALVSGEQTRAQLIAVGDDLGAGRVELNLGSMLMTLDRYDAAAAYYATAAVRFARAGDVTRSIMADIGLANAKAPQFEFEEASLLYDRSAMRARARGLSALQGVIDTNRGRMELHRGRFGQAMTSFVAALGEAERDGTPQDVADAERDLADAYLALNLLPEAVALYDRTIDRCEQVDAPMERAWALIQRSLALVRQGDAQEAAPGLETARRLFAAADNRVGAALTDLRSATLSLTRGEDAAALMQAEAAAGALREAGVQGWACESEIAAAAALAALGQTEASQRRWQSNLDASRDLPEMQAACHAGLGQLYRQQGRTAEARNQFEQAVRCTELQRAALPGDEFRAAYGADKQRPYDALVELALDRSDPEGALQVLRAIERARAPALRTALSNGDAASASEPARREQLHWLHRQWQQAVADEEMERAAGLQARCRRLEHEVAEQHRRALASLGANDNGAATAGDIERLDVDMLRARMPDDCALVSFGWVGDRLAACVLAREGLQHRALPAAGLSERISQLRFQIDSLRFNAPALRAHAPQMAQRARAHLQALHAAVWQPLLALVGDRTRVVVVPHRGLHYLPFCALHDGQRSLFERHEISLAPSVALWLQPRSGAMPREAVPRRVVAVGVGGRELPHVATEVQAVAQAFDRQPGGRSTILQEGAATYPALRQALAGADVLHLACHGQFRADSPYFSALQLADGALTVRDAASLPLQAQLVTLSACETGLSRVAPGDELLGLLRGFLLAGAPRVLATQWTVDDACTAQLMAHFYQAVLAGARPAAALREAQQALAQQQPHPYHWAPFTLHERG